MRRWTRQALFAALMAGALSLVHLYSQPSGASAVHSPWQSTGTFALIVFLLSLVLVQLTRFLSLNSSPLTLRLATRTKQASRGSSGVPVAVGFAHDQAEAILEQTQSIILISNDDGQIISINPFGQQLLGAHLSPRFLELGTYSKVERSKISQALTQLTRGELSHYQHESRLRAHDDSERIFFWTHSVLEPARDTHSKILSIGVDISAQKALEDKLGWIAEHDPLTRLINRHRFEQELETSLLWAQEHDTQCALLYIDLDNFKDVNDSCGHKAGDGILVQAAQGLAQQITTFCGQRHSLLSRISGDEFGVLVHDCNSAQANQLAENMLDSLASIHLNNDDMRFQLSGSIGVVIFPGHVSDINELLSVADHSLFQAKSLGKNQHFLIDGEIAALDQSHNRVMWREKLEAALRDRRFVLHYQPILNIRKRTISHYEVLVRLREEEGELVSPANFISMAEALGIIHDIDLYILNEAIAKQGELLRRGLDITLAINLSGKAFDNPRLAESIEAAIDKHRARAENLIFEITETAAVSDLAAAEKLMDDIQSLGCQFALDDFGVGFSSFYYLRELPVDLVKIDGSFIKDLVNNTDNIVLVRALSEVAIGFNKLSVAEFVDSLQTLHILNDAKVNYAQGYFIGAPSDVIPVEPPNFYQAALRENTSIL